MRLTFMMPLGTREPCRPRVAKALPPQWHWRTERMSRTCHALNCRIREPLVSRHPAAELASVRTAPTSGAIDVRGRDARRPGGGLPLRLAGFTPAQPPQLWECSGGDPCRKPCTPALAAGVNPAARTFAVRELVRVRTVLSNPRPTRMQLGSPGRRPEGSSTMMMSRSLSHHRQHRPGRSETRGGTPTRPSSAWQRNRARACP